MDENQQALNRELILHPEDRAKLEPAILLQIQENLKSIKYLSKFLRKPEIVTVMVKSLFKDQFFLENIENIPNCGLKKGAKTFFRGVQCKRGKYTAMLHDIKLGKFNDEVSAAIAYDKAVLSGGENPRKLNFPDLFDQMLSENVKEEINARKLTHPKSNYAGIKWTGTRWYSMVCSSNTMHFVGNFKDEREAAEWRDIVILKFGLRSTNMNFTERYYLTKGADLNTYGICFTDNCWHAQIQQKGVNRFVGNFKDPIKAAKAYDRAALEYIGKNARLNFPYIDYSYGQNNTKWD